MASKLSLLPLLALGARATVTYYNQCGGTDYTGDTSCETGSNCTVINDYYSQCVPHIIAQDNAVEESSVADLYQQCGGADFTGPTECIAPSTCVYQNPYYSQCLISTVVSNTTSAAVETTSSSKPVVVSTKSSSPKASSTTTTSRVRMSTSVKSTTTTESTTTSKTTTSSKTTTTTSKATTTTSKTTTTTTSKTTTTTTVPSTIAASSTLSAVVPTGTKLMATTTHYDDGQEGACGCGNSAGPFSWSYANGIAENVYTAAGSQALFGDGTWCGSGCGACYNVTSTGTAPPSQGTGGGAGESIIIMVTNLCPYNGNEVWCPNPDTTNNYGYSYHFDIMGGVEGWDNPIVTFEPITCPGAATSDWETCVCATSS